MVQYSDILEFVEYILDSQQRRHVAGGILLSLSALFCGCAITIMTIKKEVH